MVQNEDARPLVKKKLLSIQDSDSGALNEYRIQLSESLFKSRACVTDCTGHIPMKLVLILINFALKKWMPSTDEKLMLLWTLICMCLFKLALLLSSDIYPRVELLDHRVILFLVFWGIFILFPIVAILFYIPTSSSLEFLFLHLFTNSLLLVVVVGFFWQQPSWQVWSDISLWFWFVFPWWLVTLSILSCICWSWKQKHFRNRPCPRNSDSHGQKNRFSAIVHALNAKYSECGGENN